MSSESILIKDGSTWTAGADLSSKQFYAVKQTAAGQVNVATTGDSIVGVLLNKPTSGLPCEIALFGTVKVICGSSGMTAGDTLEVDSSSKFTTQTTGVNPVGMAIDTGVSGDIVRILLRPVTFA